MWHCDGGHVEMWWIASDTTPRSALASRARVCRIVVGYARPVLLCIIVIPRTANGITWRCHSIIYSSAKRGTISQTVMSPSWPTLWIDAQLRVSSKCRRCQRDYGYLIQVDYSTRVGYSDGINQRRRLVLFIYQSPGVVLGSRIQNWAGTETNYTVG